MRRARKVCTLIKIKIAWLFHLFVYTEYSEKELKSSKQICQFINK